MLKVEFDDEHLFKIVQNAVRSVLSENLIAPSPSPEDKELITRKEAADLAGVCVATLDNKVKSGVLRKYRTGGIVRFKRQEIIEAFSQSMFDHNTRVANRRAKKG